MVCFTGAAVVVTPGTGTLTEVPGGIVPSGPTVTVVRTLLSLLVSEIPSTWFAVTLATKVKSPLAVVLVLARTVMARLASTLANPVTREMSMLGTGVSTPGS